MLSLSRIEHLADEGSLQRGRDYFRSRRVTHLTTSQDGAVRAIVEGEQLYRVELHDRTWDCTCPVGAQGIFCKHCVAAALAYHSEHPEHPEHRDTVVPVLDETLAETRNRILSSIRTRRDLHDWRAVLSYADVAGASVDELRTAALHWGAGKVLPLTEAAIDAAVKVILRADDSNGEIGDIIGELLELHAELCTAAPPKSRRLIDWMIAFQFDGIQDFYTINVADYAAALGPKGLDDFAKALDAVETGTRVEDFTVQYNRERLAVALGDPSGIIASFQPLTRAYRMHDLAKALMEVGAVDLAIRFARDATQLEDGWQAERAGQYWCELLREYRANDEEVAARQLVFDRWPTATNAVSLAEAARGDWTERAEQVYARLRANHPAELIAALLRLKEHERAWNDAQGHPLSTELWTRLVAVRLKTDPASAIPQLRKLIESDLERADLRGYKHAVARLKQLRAGLRTLGREHEFAGVVSAIRDENRRRPRLLQELDRL